MAHPDRRKTTRTTRYARSVQNEIRKMLKEGPQSAARMHAYLKMVFGLAPQNINYHAKCVGVIMEGKYARTRIWKLPPESSAGNGIHAADEDAGETG
jgi:hypothetical protein